MGFSGVLRYVSPKISNLEIVHCNEKRKLSAKVLIPAFLPFTVA